MHILPLYVLLGAAARDVPRFRDVGSRCVGQHHHPRHVRRLPMPFSRTHASMASSFCGSFAVSDVLLFWDRGKFVKVFAPAQIVNRMCHSYLSVLNKWEEWKVLSTTFEIRMHYSFISAVCNATVQVHCGEPAFAAILDRQGAQELLLE